jgi:hypothetical protein
MTEPAALKHAVGNVLINVTEHNSTNAAVNILTASLTQPDQFRLLAIT